MIHFKFSESDPRYMYIKCDNTPDELVDVIDRSTKKAIKYHAFDYFKKMVNLVDPICYLPRYTGEPFTQDFLFNYVQPSGDRLLYGSIGLWQDI